MTGALVCAIERIVQYLSTNGEIAFIILYIILSFFCGSIVAVQVSLAPFACETFDSFALSFSNVCAVHCAQLCATSSSEKRVLSAPTSAHTRVCTD